MSTITVRARPRTSPAATDDDLVVRCREGDGAAWDELVSRHEGVLHAVARSCGLGAATADDVVQNAWVKLHGSVARLEKPESVRWWLATTVRRDAIRARHRERRWVPLDADVVDPTPVDGGLLDGERAGAVRAAIRRLSATDQRFLALLFDDESRSYCEVARLVGRPIGSIGPTRARALGRLADALRAEYGEVA